MARGADAKLKITNKILETFEGSFPYDKEIRIPVEENGEIVQIKVTLTAAKVNVENGGDVAIPIASTIVNNKDLEITEKEKAEVKDLISVLGL
jgi:hypothetical protein